MQFRNNTPTYIPAYAFHTYPLSPGNNGNARLTTDDPGDCRRHVCRDTVRARPGVRRQPNEGDLERRQTNR